jgi:hypothetical protein
MKSKKILHNAKLKDDAKKEKTSHHKELSSLKKLLSDYKVERKASWKKFKTKMNIDIEKIQKSLSKLAAPSKK